MIRKEQIEAEAKAYAEIKFQYPQFVENWEHFISGAEWADLNPARSLYVAVAQSNINKLQSQLEIAVEALEHIENNCGCPKPEDCYDKAKEALQKILGV